MSKVSAHRLEIAESTFREQLVVALRHCADGHWGLFGQNNAPIDSMGKIQAARLNDPVVQQLLDLGEEITTMRSKLGISDIFPLYERLLKTRSLRDSNTPGEPKLAKQWLESM